MHEHERPRTGERSTNVTANEDLMWDVKQRESYDARAEHRDEAIDEKGFEGSDPVFGELEAVLKELDAEGEGGQPRKLAHEPPLSH